MIDRCQIEQWADYFMAKGDFPELICRLVYASTPGLVKVNIPYGSAVYMEGFDGVIETSVGSPFVPEGKSVMEFGTNASFKSKANDDYDKRKSQNVEGLIKSETTFIFITPRGWGNKDEWIESKRKENIWKNVIVYDSQNLSQWIINVPSVEIWLASKLGLPIHNVVLGSNRLTELLSGPIQLVPEFYTTGREDIARSMETMLLSPTLRAFRASSKEEAMGFILSAGCLFSEKAKEEFYAKTLVVDTKSAFRQMGAQHSMINLVPDFDDPSVLYKAVSDGKVVLVPLGPGDDFNQEVIELPAPDRFGLEDVLKKCGVDDERSVRIIKDCSCNLSMIKKALNFPILRVDWLDNDDVNEIMPALIVERWNENCEGDKELLELVSSESYNAFRSQMILWSRKPLPPVMNVGSMWRLTSPLSLWTDLSAKISIDDVLALLKDIALKVLSDNNKKYSSQIKEGILNSLIIVGWHGDHLFGNVKECQGWVDNIIKVIIHDADVQKWNNIAEHLVLIAEASPSVFINELKRSLSASESPIMGLFNEHEGLIMPESKHPYLLWALESLAWLPECLLPVSEILLTLSEKDPGGRLSNRPFNSLVELFLPWYPHTTASFEDRKAVIEKLAKNDSVKVWDFLIALLPKHHGVSSNTHRLKWRGYDLNTQKGVSHKEWWLMTQAICDVLMSIYDGSDHKLAELIEKIEPIPHSLREKIVLWIRDNVVGMTSNISETRKALRETLWYQNRLKPDHEFRMTEIEKNAVKEAYESIKPKDIVEKNKWLFDDYAPRLPESPYEDSDFETTMKERDRLRENVLSEWLETLPLDKIVSLWRIVGEPAVFGRTLAIFHDKYDLDDVVFGLLPEKDAMRFVTGYIEGLERVNGTEQVIIIHKQRTNKMSVDDSVKYLFALYNTHLVYKYVETLSEDVQHNYWKKYPNHIHGQTDEIIYVIKKLISVGRAIDAISGSWIYAKDFPTDILQSLLKEAINAPADLNKSMDIHAVESCMEELHKRKDADVGVLMYLEWFYLPVLRDYSKGGSVFLLFQKLVEEPAFFVELLTYFYNTECEETKKVVLSKDDEAIRRDNAVRAFHLLREWNVIPGVSSTGDIDIKKLEKWVHEAIGLAKEKNLQLIAYSQIGELLAKYPENCDSWPPMELFSLMESLNSKELFNGYSIGLYNKRGFTSRGGYDGGDIERNNKRYYEELKKKCLPLYPNMANVFQDLANQYDKMAKDMDDHAIIARLDY